MSGQLPDSGGLGGWLAGGTALATALVGLARRFFVTRAELTKFIERQDRKFLEAIAQQRREFERALEQQTSERMRLHQENRETSEGVFDRLSELEKGVSRIAGRLDERFQRGERRN